MPVAVRLTSETLTGRQEQREQTGQANESALPNQARHVVIGRHGCPALNRLAAFCTSTQAIVLIASQPPRNDWREGHEAQGIGRKPLAVQEDNLSALTMSG